MRAVVTKTFIDKFSKVQQNKGAIIEAEADRIDELVAHGVVKVMEVAVTTPVAEPEAKPKATRRKAAKVEE